MKYGLSIAWYYYNEVISKNNVSLAIIQRNHTSIPAAPGWILSAHVFVLLLL